jgi:hypothetical protein
MDVAEGNGYKKGTFLKDIIDNRVFHQRANHIESQCEIY